MFESITSFMKKRFRPVRETKDQKRVIGQLHKIQLATGAFAAGEYSQYLQMLSNLVKHEHDVNPSESCNDNAEGEKPTSKKDILSKEESHFEPDVVQAGDTQVIFIKFQKDDLENPYNWTRNRKAFCVFMMMFLAFVGGFNGTSLVSGINDMTEILHVNVELSRFGYTIFFFGFALGPLVAPSLIENHGRWPWFMAGAWAMMVWSVPVSVAPHIALVIVFRFLGGFIGSIASSSISGSIAEMYSSEHRDYPMLWHTVTSFIGIVAAPISFGYVGWLMSFRWIMWILIMACGIAVILIFLFMEETHGHVILQHRANRLQREQGSAKKVYLVAGKAYMPMRRNLASSVSHSTVLLFTEPIVACLSLWMGFTWGTIYVFFGAVPLIMKNKYGFNPGQASLIFVAEIIGVLAGGLLEVLQHYFYQQGKAKRGPEARLYTSCIGGILCFAGILIFGLTQGRTHWMGPACGLAILVVGNVTIFQAIRLYFADCYGADTNSVLAVQWVFRYLFACVFPLFTDQMFDGMGSTWASVLISIVCAVLVIIPYCLVVYGKRLRLRSPYIFSDET